MRSNNYNRTAFPPVIKNEVVLWKLVIHYAFPVPPNPQKSFLLRKSWICSSCGRLSLEEVDFRFRDAVLKDDLLQV